MVNKFSLRALLIVLAMVLPFGCSSPVGQTDQNKGSLVLTIPAFSGADARTLIPELGSQLDEVEITLSKGQESFTSTITRGQSAQFNALSIGQWSVSAVGKNTERGQFLTGNQTISLSPGVNQEALVLEPSQDGAGEIFLDFILPEGHGADSAQYRIYPYDQSGGSFQPLGPILGNTLSFEQNLDGGYYFLEVDFLSGDVIVSKIAEVVWIYKNSQTYAEVEVAISGLIGRPTAPRNLQLTYSSGAVSLSWEDTSSVTEGFRIYASNDGSSYNLISSVDSDVYALNDAQLVPGSTRYYRVSAFNDSGESNPVESSISIPNDGESGTITIELTVADPSDLENILAGLSDVDGQSVLLSVGVQGVSEVTWKINGITVSTSSTLTLTPGDYQGTVLVSLVVVKDGMPYSASGEVTFADISITPAPVFSPASGNYDEGQGISLTGEGTIEFRYTKDSGSWTPWSSDLSSLPSLSLGSWVFEARATAAGMQVSPVVSASYEVQDTQSYSLYYYSASGAPTLWTWFANDGTPVMADLGYTWNTQPSMDPIGGDWYVWNLPEAYLVEAQSSALNIIFNQGETTHSRNATGWFKNGSWSDENPDERPLIAVSPSGGVYAESTPIQVEISGYTQGLSLSTYVNGVLVPSNYPLVVSDQDWENGFQLRIEAETDRLSATWSGNYSIGQETINTHHNNLRIYQIYVSAFIDTDGSGFNDGYGPNHHKGDFQGVIDAIPYIKSLGMNAIWLTPIFHVHTGIEAMQSTGYFLDDYFAVDPRLGTEDDFKRLVDTAHEAGLFVLLDGVFGHQGLGDLAPSPGGNHVPTRLRRQGEFGWEMDYSHNGTLEYYKEVATYWIEEFGIDGWRLDQAYQVPTWAWTQIREGVESVSRARKDRGETWGTLGYMVAEIWSGESAISDQAYGPEGNPALLSAFDFPGRYRLVQTLAAEESLSKFNLGAENIHDIFNTHNTYPSHARPNFFFTNHDVLRLGNLIRRAPHLGYGPENGDYWKRHKLAHAFTAAYTGPITLMYGDEHGTYAHGFVNNGDLGLYDDNASRTSGKISGFNDNEQDLIEYVIFLMNLRKNNEALWNGVRTNLVSSGTQYADLKVAGDNKIVLAMNLGTSQTTINVNNIGGNGLLDLETNQSISGSGSYAITVPALSARFFSVD